ncbi:hypothetical protein T01_10183 [Trichinella spiralis]|uniref:Uncharacterized protein n=1 Tax=Trichinella spiralis TaxID=6334 RepID=A0A0V1B3T4_TRISP|nr:hypothetical protein T01_4999 [Trichinella spiralis]KRY31228.1 hypothetical protein T01_10183 [Trichinella spiralis]
MVLRFISLKLQYDSFAFKLLNDTIIQLCPLSTFEPCLKIWSGFEILHIIRCEMLLSILAKSKIWQFLQCRMDQSERSMKFMSIIKIIQNVSEMKLDRSSLNNIIQVCTSFGVVPWRKLFQP